MKGIRKVVWAEGLFLGQQHFQQWDNYMENYVNYQHKYSQPLGWGVASLDFHQETLENGILKLKQCEIIFPDHQVVVYESSIDLPVVCDLELSEEAVIDVYLCIAANRHTEGISGYNENGQVSAWRADYRQVADVYDPSRECEMVVSSPNLLLLPNDDAKDNYVSIKVAEVFREGEGKYRLNEEYVPPVVQVRASSFLQQGLNRILELLTAKVRILRERRSQSGAGLVEFGHSDLGHFMLLELFSRTIPLLRHFRSNDDVHPEKFYLELGQLAGSLCAFSFEGDIDDIPEYIHTQLSYIFKNIEIMIRKLVNSVMPARMPDIKLTREHDSLYSADSIDSELLDNTALYLAASFESSDPGWINEFGVQVKAGSRTEIELIVQSALPGVRLTHTQRPPNRMPVKAGFEYYKLEATGHFWESVIEERSIAIFLPRIFHGANLEIVSLQE